MSISKQYTPAEIEDKWYAYWLEHNLFHSEPDEREPYTIVIPPPNVTGILHMGHILNNTIQDVLIRRARMEGKNACWVPGMDHASIATEAKVVKLLRSQGIKKSDLTRDEFLKHAFEWKEKYGGIILHQLKKLGASCDWERTRFTMDEDYYAAVIQVFCDLYEKGHIYRGLRMVNWDPAGLTAISDEEVNHKEINGKLYHVRYKVEGTENEWVTIATTRPETILGDSAVTVHPDDERYTHLVGKRVLVPLIHRSIPIIADKYVKMDFGTGCLKVTPAHDVNDYEIGQRHNLEIIDTLNPNGTLNEAAQLYVGEDRFVARKLITKDLEAAGHLVKIEEYLHQVGHSERTDAVIEPRLSLQWWVKMEEISKPALEAVENDTVQLIPPKFKNTYRHWMENVRDWCISRQLWWGQQIPAWYLDDEGNEFVVARTEEAALEKARAKTGNANLQASDLRRDPDVLDTWFSSWLWPFQVFSSLTNPGNPEAEYYYPTNDLVTGPDILFFWVARMIIAGYEFEDKKPFNNVYLTGLIRDAEGKKMSKSLGNSPDPLDLIKLYGADGMRYGILKSSPAGGDLIFDTPLDLTKEDLKSKLCEEGRNFANKIWNAFRLVKSWETGEGAPTEVQKIALEWMPARLAQAEAEIADHFEKFRISDALMANHRLVWDDFCAWFLEMMKPRMGEKMPAEALERVLDLFEDVLRSVHPFMPFISEEIWQELRPRKTGESICIASGSSVNASDFPKAMGGNILSEMVLLKETVTALRKLRLDKQISKKIPIDVKVKSAQAETFLRYESMLQRFLNTGTVEIVSDSIKGAAGVRVQTHELFVPLDADSVDIAGEIEKIQADIKYTEGFLVSVNKKLGNERFVQNAKPEIVEKERQKKADAETKLKMLQESLANLQ